MPERPLILAIADLFVTLTSSCISFSCRQFRMRRAITVPVLPTLDSSQQHIGNSLTSFPCRQQRYQQENKKRGLTTGVKSSSSRTGSIRVDLRLPGTPKDFGYGGEDLS